MENNLDELAEFLNGIGEEIQGVTTATLQDLLIQYHKNYVVRSLERRLIDLVT